LRMPGTGWTPSIVPGDGHDVPEALEDVVDTYVGPDRQLTLRMA
jgi:hypothetical protein